jgi:Rrf2 family protein
MAGVMNVSEAAALALHAVALLACTKRRMLTVREISRALRASEAHLAKVLQRLAAVGLVSSTRGPHGGFALAGEAAGITLLQVWEAIEGSMRPEKCLFDSPICGGDCILGGLIGELSRRLIEHLKSTTLADLVRAKGRKLCALTEK